MAFVLKNENGKYVKYYGKRMLSGDLVYNLTDNIKEAEVYEQKIDEQLMETMKKQTHFEHEQIKLTEQQKRENFAFKEFIKRFDVESITELIEETGEDELEMLKKAFFTLSRVTAWLIEEDDDEDNPQNEFLNAVSELGYSL